jgi:hypothetical protein
MGKRMPHQEKNKKSWNKQFIMLLPITGTLFSKKTHLKKLEENSLDFHLDIINKIDKLLVEHNLEPPSVETFHAPPISPAPRPVPIEPRPALNKTLSHREIAWEPAIGQSEAITQTIPEEFKTEFSIDPPFRFITSKEFIDTIMQKRSSPEDRIEIIDLNTLIEGTSEEGSLTGDIHNNKTEVIDIQTLKQKAHENYFITPQNETEKKEKSHIYYFSSKNDNIKKQKSFFYFSGKNDNSKKPKKIEVEQSYSPIDFEERIKKLKEEQIEAEEQRKQQEQEMYKQLEREREKLKEQQIKEEQRKRQEQERQRQLELEREKLRELQIKEEQRKRQEAEKLRRLELEREKLREQMIKEEQRKQQEAERLRQLEIEHERLREQQIKDEQRKQQEQEINRQLEREREKLEKLEMKKALLEQEKQELKQTEQKIPKQIPQLSMFNRDSKKQAKEQLRLQRLELRKARLEERQRKKEEKQAQKIKQKHIKEWAGTTESLELDDDIKKILLMTDTLLGELPEDVIKQFMQSEEFELYQKVLNKYNVK